MKSSTSQFAAIGILAIGLVWLSLRIAALDAGQRELLQQGQEIKALLEQGARAAAAAPSRPAAPQPPALPATTLLLDGASKGSPSAKLVLLEFSDFECPFCGRHTREVAPQIKRDYVDTGKLRYVFRHYPIEQLHPRAFAAAQAAECAGQQGKFWEMHGRLFANQKSLADTDLLAYARADRLDPGAFQRCVSGPQSPKIRRDLEEGARSGMTGTPNFFIGTVDSSGRLKVLRRINGAAAFASFKTAIDGLLASPELAR